MAASRDMMRNVLMGEARMENTTQILNEMSNYYYSLVYLLTAKYATSLYSNMKYYQITYLNITRKVTSIPFWNQLCFQLLQTVL